VEDDGLIEDLLKGGFDFVWAQVKSHTATLDRPCGL
jgi:hypothetical protein